MSFRPKSSYCSALDFGEVKYWHGNPVCPLEESPCFHRSYVSTSTGDTATVCRYLLDVHEGVVIQRFEAGEAPGEGWRYCPHCGKSLYTKGVPPA